MVDFDSIELSPQNYFPIPIITMTGLEKTISKILKYQCALQAQLDKLTRPPKVIARVGKFMLDFLEDTVIDTTTTPTSLTTSSVDTITRISNLIKIQCAPNAKVPPKNYKWTDPQNQTTIKPKGNYGVVCGSANNLIVLDVDVKDDGVAELQDYIKNHGNINTYTVRTPSGGYHYYFNYKGANEIDNERIARWLRNSTKYRAKGLDIRTQGGYVVGPGSRVGGKEYEVVKNTDIGNMPSALIDWLVASVTLSDG